MDVCECLDAWKINSLHFQSPFDSIWWTNFQKMRSENISSWEKRKEKRKAVSLNDSFKIKRRVCVTAELQELIENVLRGANMHWQADGLDDLHPFLPVIFFFLIIIIITIVVMTSSSRQQLCQICCTVPGGLLRSHWLIHNCNISGPLICELLTPSANHRKYGVK